MIVGLPTAEHVIFIPAVLLLGIVVGWVLGARAARQRLLEQQARARK